MGEPRHTPGPWSVEQPWNGFSAIRGPSGELVFALAAGMRDEKRPDDVCEANAHLIAAAPCMYEALQKISLMSKEHEHDLFSATQVAHTALLKAQGKQTEVSDV